MIAPTPGEARALSWLMARLMAEDEAGEIGECCANPYCRACTVLQRIDSIAREYPETGEGA